MDTGAPHSIGLCLLIAIEACSLFRTNPSERYELVNVPESIAPPQNGTILLMGDSRIQWSRVYAAADGGLEK